jgi:UDP-glucose 6-dehydrogenase
VRDAVAADPRIGPAHLSVVDTSGHAGAKPGRGAGGHCFIKDFAALRDLYKQVVGDDIGLEMLTALEKKNIAYLRESGKDLDLLEGVYGAHS